MKQAKLLSQLAVLLDCATRSGIAEHTILGYGTMLGMVREGRPLNNDNDGDICILTDRITKEQEDAFYGYLKEAKVFAFREREKRRLDTGRLLWLSCKMEEDGIKTCMWFQQLINGYYWHSKGDTWVTRIGARLKPAITQAQAIMKGVVAEPFKRLKVVNFCGQQWRIPIGYGEVLDHWYPDWATERSEQSREEILMIIPNWRNPNTWKTMIK